MKTLEFFIYTSTPIVPVERNGPYNLRIKCTEESKPNIEEPEGFNSTQIEVISEVYEPKFKFKQF